MDAYSLDGLGCSYSGVELQVVCLSLDRLFFDHWLSKEIAAFSKSIVLASAFELQHCSEMRFSSTY